MKKQRFLLSILFLISMSVSAVERIVSIGGDVTEIVFALGAGSEVVARDSTSVNPPDVNALPDVGYMRQLNAEGVLAMRPTLVILTELAQPSLAIKQIEAAGVKIVTVSGKLSMDDIPDKINTIAKALGREEKAAILINDYRQALAKIPRTPIDTRVLFILNMNGSVPLAAGQKTAADAIIQASGAKNAMQGFTNYRPLNQEGVITSKPDLIVLSTDGVKALGNQERVWSLPGLAFTPAGKKKNLLILDTMTLLGFGLHTPSALAELRQAAEKAR